MELTIRQLPPRRADEAVETLTRAFDADPIFNHYFPDPADREAVFDTFFDDLIRANLRFGHVYGAFADGRVIGAAVWHPPFADDPTFEDRSRSDAAARRVAAISERAAADLFAGFGELEKLHPERPHWHLMFIGVLKDARARQIGSRLMAPVLSLADEHGECCYLETPFPETHAFYQRHGFAITSTIHPFRGAPTIWTMSREAQPATRR